MLRIPEREKINFSYISYFFYIKVCIYVYMIVFILKYDNMDGERWFDVSVPMLSEEIGCSSIATSIRCVRRMKRHVPRLVIAAGLPDYVLHDRRKKAFPVDSRRRIVDSTTRMLCQRLPRAKASRLDKEGETEDATWWRARDGGQEGKRERISIDVRIAKRVIYTDANKRSITT